MQYDLIFEINQEGVMKEKKGSSMSDRNCQSREISLPIHKGTECFCGSFRVSTSFRLPAKITLRFL